MLCGQPRCPAFKQTSDFESVPYIVQSEFANDESASRVRLQQSFVRETLQYQSDRCAGNVEAESQRVFGNAFDGSEFSRQDQFSQTQHRAACLGFSVCGQTRSVSIDGFRCTQSNTLQQSDVLIYHTLLWARALCPRSITKTNS